ncbi:MAG: hypothetical protein UR31_C0007G0024 [Parcubacteria group bacterium GW2011_GWA2_33_14]|nr:MAG: hypothetical protein UR31_C0007G0024 [Parcubacteria group bacterium GW2011_GWA2_33_14]
MIFITKIIKVVHNNGYNKGVFNSSKNISISQIKPILIAKPKSPRVIILNGRVITSKMGFTKKFNNPKITPKSR